MAENEGGGEEGTYEGGEDEERHVDLRVRRDVRDRAVGKLVNPEAHGAEEEEDGEVEGRGHPHEELSKASVI